MSRILPLPADAISQIHSSKNITSLKDVILSLLENSLDARSTKVTISVDFRRGGCTVEDDGVGIPAAEFAESGGLGRMYHTSKRAASLDGELGVHGCHGAFLASLAALSLMTVTSRHAASSGQATLSMHQGKVIARQSCPPPPDLLTAEMQHGTEVRVRDLFGNMPVRVKQRAVAADDGNYDDKAWHQLKRGIAALLLAWPAPCSVRVTASNLPDRKIQLSGSSNVSLTTSGLRQLNTGREQKYGIKEALPILFQAALASLDSRQNWIPISTSAVDMTVCGLICIDPSPTKQCQFIALGIHPCSHGDLYDVINTVFANSSFGTVDDVWDIDEDEKERRKRDRRFKGDGFTRKEVRGRKAVDRWAMFVLKVDFRDGRALRGSAEGPSEATLKGVTEVLEATVTQWLAAHHFRPRKRRKRRKDGALERLDPGTISDSRPSTGTPYADRQMASRSPSTLKKRRILDLSGRPQSMDSIVLPTRSENSPFAQWSHIKSGRQAIRSQPTEQGTIFKGKGETALERAHTPQRSLFTLPAIEAGALSNTRKRHRAANPTAKNSQSANPLPTDVVDESEDFGSISSSAMLAAEANIETTEPAEEVVEWIDLKTKQTYRVNVRTGVVLPIHHGARPHPPTATTDLIDPSVERRSAAIYTATSSTGRPLSLGRRVDLRPDGEVCYESRNDEVGGERWLPGFLREWKNPVFVRKEEEGIPVAHTFDVEDLSRHSCHHPAHTQDFEHFAKGLGTKLTKADLRMAKVVAQVDRKFILCTTTSASTPGGEEALVLVDQHAASERVILERVFSGLCTPPSNSCPEASKVRTTALEKPLRFQISETEHALFLSSATQEQFEEWGIIYNSLEREAMVSAPQHVRAERKKECILTVTHLPPCIAERCVQVPRILIDLLRSELYSSITPSHRPLSSHEMDDSPMWLRRLGSCPKGIIEMLNSRACRSAVMFNDELSLSECEALIDELGRCVFPFMCAHGRVSMVPVVGLRGDGFGDGAIDRFEGLGGEDEGRVSGEGAVFGRWLEKHNRGSGVNC